MKEIRLLKPDYKKIDGLYDAFKNDRIRNNEKFLSEEKVEVENISFFPIYIADYRGEEKVKKFINGCKIINKNYGKLSRDCTFSGRFWTSLLLQYFVDDIKNEYPKVLESEKDFKNIVLKKFDWENYIYKMVIISQAVVDNVEGEANQEKLLKLAMENLDVVNYVIKYPIFRNDVFLVNILRIIDKYDISEILKAKIKQENLKGLLAEKIPMSADERYGRRVIFEFNKAYPVLMVPMLSFEELEKKFFEYLNFYYDIRRIPTLYKLLK